MALDLEMIGFHEALETQFCQAKKSTVTLRQVPIKMQGPHSRATSKSESTRSKIQALELIGTVVSNA